MTVGSALSIFLLSFFASITFNGFFRNIAKKNNILIDIPDKSRKFHFRATPLTGGISLFFGSVLSGLLISGLTSIPIETNFSEQGFLKDSSFVTDTSLKKFEVNGIDYDLSIEREKDSNSLNINVASSNNLESSLKVIPKEDGSFEVLMPDGSKSLYTFKNGTVSKVSDVMEKITPISKNVESVKVDTITLAMILCGGLIVAFMLVDDFFGLRASLRIIFQAAIVLFMILISEEYITNLGNLYGNGDVNLGAIAIPFTIFCVVGLMNAYNMIDGLNGICASFGLVPLIFLTFFGSVKYGLLIPIGAILGFMAYNLGYLGKKRRVFLGDSGSNYIGFTVAFLCITYSQDSQIINPVTALWLVAIPLLDCLGVIVSRVKKGLMPFTPGRDHLHHKLLDKGYSPKNILYIFILISIVLCSVGCLLEFFFPNDDYISLGLFILFAILYYAMTKSSIDWNKELKTKIEIKMESDV
ncbi:undecaprenyl/decaprenyl-phosphate alpha-N-acetylglucosaminyl 1-phosphate transferase [Gammaproteobacteria bacterium]|nr:undecaprenyl/decaprenyl-phosphate alpha-N-acetylglucosaminyl 1-phosphate transferase [Gammaproteobacteria bacterium]